MSTETIIDDYEQNYSHRTNWIIGLPQCKGVRCLRCGAMEEFPANITINAYCSKTAAFALIHQKCEPDIP